MISTLVEINVNKSNQKDYRVFNKKFKKFGLRKSLF